MDAQLRDELRRKALEILEAPINSKNGLDMQMVAAYEKITGKTLLQRQSFIEGMRWGSTLLNPEIAPIIYEVVDSL